MEKLAGLLNRERVLLELLLFKLVSLRQLLVAGQVRFLPWAAEEVDRATTKVREIELRRTLAVEELHESFGSPADPITLRVLAEQAPEPWRTIFAEHHKALFELASDLEVAAGAARRLAGTGGASVTATLDRLTGAPEPTSRTPVGAGAAYGPGAATTYGPGARWEPAAPEARFTGML
jgi:hypothetical protein